MLLLPDCRCEEEEEGIIPGAVHTIINTECVEYFSYQCLAFVHAFKRSGQPGNLTRVMNCSPEMREEFSQEDMEIMPTYVVPQAAYNNKTKDHYAPYNRPAGIMYWLEHAKPKEEWILVVDPDTYIRHPLIPEKFQIQEGWVLATQYNYLKGVKNELATMHIPEVEKRYDTYAGPKGRSADEVGCFLFIRQKDLKKLAPLWLQYSEDVRENRRAWNLTGDTGTKEGGKPWISEMYGLVYAMAHLGLKSVIDPTLQIYPEYSVDDVPHIVHYGLAHSVLDFKFDKHNHFDFDTFKCPPWQQRDKDGGLFSHPPYPHQVPKTPDNMRKRYGQLLVIEAVNTLNQALCERHKLKCNPSDELTLECGLVDSIGVELMEDITRMDQSLCKDFQDSLCNERAKAGECIADWISMNVECRQACGLCYGCNFRTTYKIGASSGGVMDKNSADNRRYSLEKQDIGPNNEELMGPFTEEKQLRLLCLNTQQSEMSRNPKCASFVPQQIHFTGDRVLVCSEVDRTAEEELKLWIVWFVVLGLGTLFIWWRCCRRKVVEKGKHSN